MVARRNLLIAMGAMSAVPASAQSRDPAGAPPASTLAAAKTLYPAGANLADGNTIFVAGRGRASDGYGGYFAYEASDRASAFPNDAMGFTDAAGRRWKRVWDNLHLYPEWFGAAGDGETDDSAAFAALFAFLNPNRETDERRGQVVHATLQARRYAANVVLPADAIRGAPSNPYSTFSITGAGMAESQIAAFDPSRPAISFDGSSVAGPVTIMLRDFRVVQNTSTRAPGVSLIGSAECRINGSIENVWVRQNRYDAGGGHCFHVERHLGFDMRFCNSEQGHYALYLSNGSNCRVWNFNARVHTGGFVWINSGGANSFYSCRIEDGRVATTAPDLAVYRLVEARNNMFVGCGNEGSTSIRSTILLEGFGQDGRETLAQPIEALAGSGDTLTAPGHGLFTGDPVTEATPGAAPARVPPGKTYFAIKVSPDSFKLAASQKDAFGGKAMRLPDAGRDMTLKAGSNRFPCAYNRFIGMALACPERDDVPTAFIRMKGAVHDNSIEGYASSLASEQNGSGKAVDLLFETGADGQRPYRNTIELAHFGAGGARPLVVGVREGRMNKVRIRDDSNRETLLLNGGRDLAEDTTLLRYEAEPGAVYTNTGARGAVTVSLPAALHGAGIQFIKMAEPPFRIVAAGGETIRALPEGARLDAVGDSLQLYCEQPGTWEVLSRR